MHVSRVPVADLCSLWAEGPTSPMNIALLLHVDPPPAGWRNGLLADVRAHVADRLHRAPLLRQKLAEAGIGRGSPLWVDDPAFSLERHVVAAPSSGMAFDAWLAWCAQRAAVPLDRRRPLWRMEVCALGDGRAGVLVVAHHVVADGLRGVALMSVLLDDSVADPVAWRPAPKPPGGELVRDAWRTHRRQLASLLSGVRRLPALRSDVTAARTAMSPAPRTSLTGPIAHGRRVELLRWPLPLVHDAARARGATVNDLLLAAVAAGLGGLLQARGECADALLRASVPIGARAGDSGGVMLIGLPAGEPPDSALVRVVEQTRRDKRAGGVRGYGALLDAPVTVAHLGVLAMRRWGSRSVNLYVTNVPGPPRRLRLAGGEVRALIPIAPLVAGVRLSVVALSYAEDLCVVLHSDATATDLDVLAAATDSAMRRLCGCQAATS